MKKIFIVIIVCLGVVSCQQKEKETVRLYTNENNVSINDEIDSVKKLVIKSFEDIWSNLDSTKIEEYHTKDFLLLENGIVWNNDSVKSYLNRERIETEEQKYKRINRFDFIKSDYNENLIWIAYDNYGTWVKGIDTLGTVHWLESAIAIREPNGWKLKQLHSTRVRNKK